MYVIIDAQDNHASEWKYLAEFSRTYLATSVNAAGSIDDACNAMLEDICLRHDFTGLFNQKNAKVTAYDKKNGCKDVCDCIDYFHEDKPYVRYSYLDNVFRYYHLREVSKRLQAMELRVFRRAADETGTLERLFKRWFPTSTVHPYVPSEEMKNAAALEYLTGMGIFKRGRLFTREEHGAMIVRLNEIYGTTLTSLNSLIKKCVPYKLEQVSRNSGTTCYGLYRCVANPKAQAREPAISAA